MTKLHVAYTVAAVSIAVAFATVVFLIVRPTGIVATLSGPSVSGQCNVGQASGLLTMPGTRLGCALNVALPLLWPVIWAQGSGQFAAEPGSLSVGTTTGVSFGLPGQLASGGGR